MKPQSIQLVVKIDSPVYFKGFLDDFFRRDKSPVFPICVIREFTVIRKDGKFADIETYNYRVVEAQNNPYDVSRELAKIHMNTYPSNVVVFFEGDKLNDLDWGKVINLVQEVITKAQQMEFEIISVVPTELMPAKLIPEEDKTNKYNAPGKYKPNKSSSSKRFGKIKEETKENYRDIYSRILDCKEEMKEQYRQGNTKSPDVSMKEIIDYLANEIGETLSARTVRRIIAFGKEDIPD